MVHAAGYVPSNRSHFESQDILETGDVDRIGLTSGWINRYLEVVPAGTSPIRALALRSSLPASMRGGAPGAFGVSNVSELVFPGTLPDERATLETIVRRSLGGPYPTGQAAYASMTASFDLIDHLAGFDPASFPPQNGAQYDPGNPLAMNLQEVAQLIRADLGIEIFQVELGGWDHHAQIVNNLAGLVPVLDDAVANFLIDLGTELADVTLVTLTDFGREARENGSAGTDHGMGQAMFVAGSSVRGGDPGGNVQVHGTWPGLQNLVDGRHLAPANDYRDVLGELLVDHMGLSTLDLTHVFPGLTYRPLGLL